MSARSSSRIAALLLVIIVVLTIIAGQPVITAMLLPVFTALFVTFVDKWLKARETPLASNVSGQTLSERLDRLSRLSVRVGRGRRVNSVVSPDSRLLLTATLCLFFLGAVMVYSSSSRHPGFFTHDGTAVADSIRFVVFGSLGVLLMMILARNGLRLARRFTATLLGLSFFLVLSTYIPHIGIDVYGARRWVGNSLFEFQPSELMKVALVLYSAHLVATRPSRIANLTELSQPLLYVVGICCLLIMREPDIGTASVIGVSIMALLLAAGLPLGRLAVIVGTPLALVFMYALVRPYARARLTTFLDPWGHASGSGFQVVQGQIGIGSGGLLGSGLGNSIQKAYYLPQANTGFIMAIIGEELGFFGIGMLLFLYGVFAYAGLGIALRAQSVYGRLVAIGLTSAIVVQAVYNIFGVLGLAPELDVGLPFVSYGSSDLVMTFVSVGLLLNIAREDKVPNRGPTGVRHVDQRLPPLIGRRIRMSLAFFLMLLVVAGLRSLNLATTQSARLRRDAAAQQLATEVTPAPRGAITDRFGTTLVGSEPAAEISADPHLLSQPTNAANLLAPLLGRSASAILQELTENSGFVYLAHGLPLGRAREILAQHIPGVRATPTTRRTYPHGSLATQVLGIVGLEGHGTAGLEYGWDKVLQGVDGARNVVTNAIGQEIAGKQIRRMVPGESLQLTLDSYVQAEIEYILAGIAHGCDCGGVGAVVLDPNTGAVLALANWPRVRPSDRTSVDTEALQDHLRNWIIDYNFEPGAALAAFTFAGALNESLVSPESLFIVPRRVNVGPYAVEEAAGAGSFSASQIVRGVSRTGTLLMASHLGLSRLTDWLHRFGFGVPSGIDLPGESPGHVPDNSEYGHSSLTRLPLGQDLTMTPIQLATAYAAIAGNGVLHAPHVVARVSGKAAPLPRHSQILSPAAARTLRQMLSPSGALGVETEAPAGDTASKPGVRTGVVAGFAPVHRPQAVTVTLIADQQHGRADAEALANSAYHQIMDFLLSYLGSR